MRYLTMFALPLALILAALGSAPAPARAEDQKPPAAAAAPAPEAAEDSFELPAVAEPGPALLPDAVQATLTQRVYLPLVGKNMGAALANGDFEAGAANWTATSAKGRTLIRTTFVGAVTPHSGQYAAWLGGAYSEQSTISQTNVLVPAGAPYLAYWRWIASYDYCGYDFGYVRVNGAAVETYNLCAANDTNGWVKRTLNLSAHAGQRVTLAFQAATDGSLNSNLFIDDISFQAAP